MHLSEELQKAIRRGDRRAQSELYRICYPTMVRVCTRFYRSVHDAVPVMSEVFLKVIQRMKESNHHEKFQGWLYLTTLHTVIDDLRKSRPYREQIQLAESMTVFETQNSNAEFSPDQQFDTELLEKMIQNLPEGQRTVFNLYAIEGFAHAEICALLRIPEGTSKYLLHQAREMLKYSLKKYEKVAKQKEVSKY